MIIGTKGGGNKMKEVSYNNVLGQNIEKSKIRSGFWKDLLRFVCLGSGVALTILGVYQLFEIGLVTVAAFFGGFVAASAAIVGISTHKNNQKKQEARESLSALSDSLQNDGVNLSIADMQKAVVTENKRELKETNRKGEVTNVDEIINRYYMLDDKQQIQVLQQTMSKCKSDSSISNTMHLQLLESEDLKEIELPEVVVKKSLRFNDAKK